ncbi:tetrahydromethanopterin S-methyltransferase, subunit F [Candidatus Methanoperedens nitroreducens]|uniref:Tetrahydromethanopterin S-methyltransferase, subunit F n=1 Tax=Candidatus Methanoperedens nitratireducens TaxID=1392998 RepID=A0A062UZY6_9EURY|nr:tetrahydromethanopterin S-methyltransferase subunit F [Candidatus Methanoperedens nitroreducens]KCZ72431.1 tetrahydromethanopterin S-methyltransferase, subunit F [Candidatus Methanoperedens nitroreducens]MDJ1423634.1 tetrahydromethanopterin S-methyltransferase subunit F [Candidatus Methanoperedens sp.]
MNEKIPLLVSPNARELNRMVSELERRVMIIGRDQRTFSGIFNLRARAYFVFGFLLALGLVFLAMVMR